MSYAITIRELDETPAMVIRRKVRPEDLGAALGDMLPAVYMYVTKQGSQPAGAPFVCYTSMYPDGFQIEAGMPVAAPMAGGGEGDHEVHAIALPAGKAAVTVHKGPYEKLGDAHQALEHWLEDNRHDTKTPRWESYINDPQEVGDPAETCRCYVDRLGIGRF